MKILYLDCSMGAAGDMLASALYELVPEASAVLKKIQIPHVVIDVQTAVRSGITGTHIDVTVDGHREQEGMHAHHHSHPHHSLEDIRHIVSHLDLSETVKQDVMEVYHRIAKAEAHVHNTTVDSIHFHEVGTMDAIADVCMVCALMEQLHPDRVLASAIHVGKGTVKCAHGILPVPAPATAYLLKGIPVYAKEIEAELCTPTGAALLAYFVDRFQSMPAMTMDAIGYGMGTKEFEQANCVRAIYGDSQEAINDQIIELECNIDDMSAEALGYALEVLMDAGAKEVFMTPVVMKKSRPGQVMHVLCTPENREDMVRLLFRHTTTIGIRAFPCERFILDRQIKETEFSIGKVHKKISQGYGVTKEKWEFEDLKRIAEEQGMSLEEVKQIIGKETRK